MTDGYKKTGLHGSAQADLRSRTGAGRQAERRADSIRPGVPGEDPCGRGKAESGRGRRPDIRPGSRDFAQRPFHFCTPIFK